jgi:hypothetical protein
MTSPRKIEANRRNALRSTGPRTDAGKTRSRRNAFKHGLEIPINRDDVFAEQIETLTTELAPQSAKPHEIVRLAAEWQLEVARVQATRVGIINRKLEQQGATGDEAVSEEARVASAVAAALPDLLALDRYERRALSRLRKVLRSLGE